MNKLPPLELRSHQGLSFDATGLSPQELVLMMVSVGDGSKHKGTGEFTLDGGLMYHFSEEDAQIPEGEYHLFVVHDDDVWLRVGILHYRERR
jgi:hypothetical protein